MLLAVRPDTWPNGQPECCVRWDATGSRPIRHLAYRSGVGQPRRENGVVRRGWVDVDYRRALGLPNDVPLPSKLGETSGTGGARGGIRGDRPSERSPFARSAEEAATRMPQPWDHIRLKSIKLTPEQVRLVRCLQCRADVHALCRDESEAVSVAGHDDRRKRAWWERRHERRHSKHRGAKRRAPKRPAPQSEPSTESWRTGAVERLKRGLPKADR